MLKILTHSELDVHNLLKNISHELTPKQHKCLAEFVDNDFYQLTQDVIDNFYDFNFSDDTFFKNSVAKLIPQVEFQYKAPLDILRLNELLSEYLDFDCDYIKKSQVHYLNKDREQKTKACDHKSNVNDCLGIKSKDEDSHQMYLDSLLASLIHKHFGFDQVINKFFQLVFFDTNKVLNISQSNLLCQRQIDFLLQCYLQAVSKRALLFSEVAEKTAEYSLNTTKNSLSVFQASLDSTQNVTQHLLSLLINVQLHQERRIISKQRDWWVTSKLYNRLIKSFNTNADFSHPQFIQVQEFNRDVLFGSQIKIDKDEPFFFNDYSDKPHFYKGACLKETTASLNINHQENVDSQEPSFIETLSFYLQKVSVNVNYDTLLNFAKFLLVNELQHLFGELRRKFLAVDYNTEMQFAYAMSLSISEGKDLGKLLLKSLYNTQKDELLNDFVKSCKGLFDSQVKYRYKPGLLSIPNAVLIVRAQDLAQDLSLTEELAQALKNGMFNLEQSASYYSKEKLHNISVPCNAKLVIVGRSEYIEYIQDIFSNYLYEHQINSASTITSTNTDFVYQGLGIERAWELNGSSKEEYNDRAWSFTDNPLLDYQFTLNQHQIANCIPQHSPNESGEHRDRLIGVNTNKSQDLIYLQRLITKIKRQNVEVDTNLLALKEELFDYLSEYDKVNISKLSTFGELEEVASEFKLLRENKVSTYLQNTKLKLTEEEQELFNNYYDNLTDIIPITNPVINKYNFDFENSTIIDVKTISYHLSYADEETISLDNQLLLTWLKLIRAKELSFKLRKTSDGVEDLNEGKLEIFSDFVNHLSRNKITTNILRLSLNNLFLKILKRVELQKKSSKELSHKIIHLQKLLQVENLQNTYSHDYNSDSTIAKLESEILKDSDLDEKQIISIVEGTLDVASILLYEMHGLVNFDDEFYNLFFDKLSKFNYALNESKNSEQGDSSLGLSLQKYFPGLSLITNYHYDPLDIKHKYRFELDKAILAYTTNIFYATQKYSYFEWLIELAFVKLSLDVGANYNIDYDTKILYEMLRYGETTKECYWSLDYLLMLLKLGNNSLEELNNNLNQRKFRNSPFVKLQNDAIVNDVNVIQTSGHIIGQANGLVWSESSEWGREPSGGVFRLAATTKNESGEFIDIDEATGLAGSLAMRANLVSTTYINSLFNKKLNMSGAILTEQLYEETDGDSATITSFAVIASALGGFPLNQGLAMTGVIDLQGRVQAVGGLNQKVEAFQEICKLKYDLKPKLPNYFNAATTTGVIIPAVNQVNLQLSDRVLNAVKNGKFYIFTVNHASEVLELLAARSFYLESDSDLIVDHYVYDSNVNAVFSYIVEMSRNMLADFPATDFKELAQMEETLVSYTPFINWTALNTTSDQEKKLKDFYKPDFNLYDINWLEMGAKASEPEQFSLVNKIFSLFGRGNNSTHESILHLIHNKN